MSEYLKNIRPQPDNLITLQKKLFHFSSVLLFGAILGLLTKYIGNLAIDGSLARNIESELGKFLNAYLGFWIFIATIIGAWSRSPRIAAIHVFIFFASMLCTYYIYERTLFGFFPTRYFLAWSVLAICSLIGGYVVWFSRGNGWVAFVVDHFMLIRTYF